LFIVYNKAIIGEQYERDFNNIIDAIIMWLSVKINVIYTGESIRIGLRQV
jgi:hypothetical protein